MTRKKHTPPKSPGRPKTLGHLTERFMVRCTPEEKARWEEQAARNEQSLSHFARRAMRAGLGEMS